jgi:hypothetical protein
LRFEIYDLEFGHGRPNFTKMKKIFVVTLFALTACGGSLSEEQRRKIREDREQHTIIKVTEAQITEAAFASGRRIAKSLEKFQPIPSTLDSISRNTKTKIRWVVPGATNALEIEKQLIDAYINSVVTGSLEDNIQKIRNESGETDTLLYTKPVVKKLADGSEQFEGAWSIWISKKQLILEMGRK